MLSRQASLTIQTLFAFVVTEAIVIAAAFFITTHLSSAMRLPFPTVTARGFLLTFLFATALLLFLIKRIRHKAVFESIFALSIFSGVWFVSSLILPEFALPLALIITAVRYVAPYILLQNVLLMIGIAGISTAIGIGASWQTLALVLMILAVYDIIAVYGTGHMVTMFKSMADQGVIFALIIPEQPRLLLRRLKDVNNQEGFFFLGTGDLALPCLFIASAALLGWTFALGAAVGSCMGLMLTNMLFARLHRRPMPALPPIVLGTLAGFFVTMLLTRYVV